MARNPDKIQRQLNAQNKSTGEMVDFAQIPQEPVLMANEPAEQTVATPEITPVMDTAPASPAVRSYHNRVPLVQSFCAQIDKYAAENPRNTSDGPKRIIEKQRILVNTLKSIVMMQDESDFGFCLNYVLEKFHEYRDDAFSPVMVSRMINQLGLSPMQTDNTRYFLDFLTVFSDPRGRNDLMRRYNVGRACDFAGPYKERLINYISYLAG